MLRIIKDINGFELNAELWSGAVDTLNAIMENDKFQELMELLEELFSEPTEIMTINDFLWFENDFIYEQLDIDPEKVYRRK